VRHFFGTGANRVPPLPPEVGPHARLFRQHTTMF
jgi:hypothetical protein